jgi:hypothetical protein
MWFANNSTSGKCPARPTGHSFTGSGNYTLPNNLDFNSGQQGWVWCPRCQGLWFAFTSSPGVCQAGPGGHDDLGAIRDANYALDVNSGGGQTNWRWCQQCMGLWFAGNSTNGVCPATSVGGHSLSGSGNYHIDKD